MRRLVIPAFLAALGLPASSRAADEIGPVFYVALENHNWTQPASFTETEPIFGNPAAPFINSLVTPGHPNAAYTSYASNYRNVVNTRDAPYAVHPSLANYIWHEAGDNFGVRVNDDPYGVAGIGLNTTQHLTGLLQARGISWRSYQEGIDLVPRAGGVNDPDFGSLTNQVADPSRRTVPLRSFAGTSPDYTNPYNGSHQYDYAAKHNAPLYFADTNGGGGNDRTPANPMAGHYAPMEALAGDLAGGSVARYNYVTPDQFNDMHSNLGDGTFTYNGTTYGGDAARIAQGDNFLAQVVPLIMASDAFQKYNGLIVIWGDECEGDELATNGEFAGIEIVISKLAKGNAYNGTIAYDHSSDLKTLQELFGVAGDTPNGFLGAAATATDLADLFVVGALPNAGATSLPAMPEPAPLALAGLFAAGLFTCRRRRH